MYANKPIFTQVMEHLPSHTFRRCVQRFQGDRWVKRFSCSDQYRRMAFAQLTYRESLRDIEACLRAQSSKLVSVPARGVISPVALAMRGALV